MTLAEQLEAALTTAGSQRLRDLMADAAKHIRHLELVHAEAIRALGEHTGADVLIVRKPSC